MSTPKFLLPVANWLSSPAMIERLSKPGFMKWAIAGFITVNMITWPVFIMCDRKTPAKARAYSAERQFFQELLSLGCQLSIASLFELAGAKAGAWLFPDHFQNKASQANPHALFQLSDWRRNSKNGWYEAVRHNAAVIRKICESKTPEVAKQFKSQMVPINETVRGSIRAGSTAGSLIALVVVAPWVNNLMLSTFLKGVDSVLSTLSRGKFKLIPDEASSVQIPRGRPYTAMYASSGVLLPTLFRPVNRQPAFSNKLPLPPQEKPSADLFQSRAKQPGLPEIVPSEQNLNYQHQNVFPDTPPINLSRRAPLYSTSANPPYGNATLARL